MEFCVRWCEDRNVAVTAGCLGVWLRRKGQAGDPRSLEDKMAELLKQASRLQEEVRQSRQAHPYIGGKSFDGIITATDIQ